MTDRSTDDPEDQPVPPDTEETPATEAGLAEQETMAEAVAMGVGPDEQEPAGPNELAAAAEPNELAGEVDIDDLEEPGEPGGEDASDLDANELEAAATAAEADERADSRVLEEGVEPRGAPAGAAARGAAKAPTSVRAGGRTALEVDPALRIRDRASQVFVALTVVVFVAIFANAMLFGVGGAVTKTPEPTPISTPGASGSPAPSGAATPTSTAAPSAS